CVLSRRPPQSPPFPYTTLFRSAPIPPAPQAGPLRPLLAALLRRDPGGRPGTTEALRMLAAASPASAAPPAAKRKGRGKAAVPPADRKSTRLNSSHVKISYAVFC